ncbi:hypothetical protein ANCCEY_10783 [Ancylostoma ceylanicum]|uniref:ABC transporter domain-containing protein n=1 Tax=Ancylostoma ceylanicum TaxID=53326 RepID=A0A0D6LR57_9BILA|nr:hypothetical protein ANCCEY_10783 [Ancylostoma ceylanicum]
MLREAELVSNDGVFQKKQEIHENGGGQRRRVCIGVALMNPSKLTRHQVWGLLKKMRLSGKAIVLSSHSMEECEALCSRIGVLVKGRLVAIGASQALKTRRGGVTVRQTEGNSQFPGNNAACGSTFDILVNINEAT